MIFTRKVAKTLMIYNKNNFFEPLCKVYTKIQQNLLYIDFYQVEFWDTLDEWRENTDLANMIRKIKKMLRELLFQKWYNR